MARTIDTSVEVKGLKELNRHLKDAGDGMQKELGKAGKAAAEVVAAAARARTPVRSGRARDSVRAGASSGGGVVRAGGAKVPYFAWLDWGGAVGRNKSVVREFRKEGRIIYPALGDKRAEVIESYERGVHEVLQKAGLL